MPDLFLALATKRERRLEKAVLRQWDITYPQFLAIEFAFLAGGAMPLGELADSCDCSRGNMTGIIDRLEAAGLMYRKPGTDRRVMLACLTSKGNDVAMAAMAALYSHPSAQLPPEVKNYLMAEYEASAHG